MIFKLKNILFLFIFLANTLFLTSQVKTSIRGMVVDEKGAPIFAASLYLNSNQGAYSEEDGSFQITDVIPGSYNLTASFVGFDSQTKFNIIIKSKGNRSFNFILIEFKTEVIFKLNCTKSCMILIILNFVLNKNSISSSFFLILSKK